MYLLVWETGGNLVGGVKVRIKSGESTVEVQAAAAAASVRLLLSIMNRMGSLRESLDQQGHYGLSSQSGATTGPLLSLTPHASALANLSRLISGPLMPRHLPEVSRSHVMRFSDTSSLHRLTRSGGRRGGGRRDLISSQSLHGSDGSWVSITELAKL